MSRSNEAKRLNDIRERGVEVIELSEEQREAFVDATRSVHEKWTPKIGAELLDAARAAIAE